MVRSKEWDWKKVEGSSWLNPCEESYYLADRWIRKGFRSVLDLGCGLGRHSVYFAKRGLDVSAFDLSVEGTNHLRQWADRENVKIDIRVGDMLRLPYPSRSFDGVFAYHVISHTDTAGMEQIISEIERVLNPGGEIYLTVCSKDSGGFLKAGYPKIDENTIVKTGDGPEKGIPHFYADFDDILRLFYNFDLVRIRHTNDCYFEGKKQDSRHFYILGRIGDTGSTGCDGDNA